MNVCKFIEKNKLIFYFVVVLAISWSIWIPMAFDYLDIIEFKIPLIVGSTIGAFGPLITIIILDKITNKVVNVNEIFASIWKRKSKIIWFLLAALAFPLLTIAGNFINYLTGSEAQFQIFNQELLQIFGLGLIGIIPLAFFAMLLSSPLLEEPGWRGFAVSEIQGKFGKHLGSFLLGSFWYMWHIPLHIASGLEISFYSYLSMVLFSFAIDSIFNLSNENLLTAMFAHSSANVTFIFIYSGTNNIYVLILFLFAIFALRIIEWKRKNQKGEFFSF